MSANHDLRRQHESHRNEFARNANSRVRDQDYYAVMRAVNAARIQYWALPPVCHTDDPRTALGRLAGAVMTARRELDLDAAVQMAALALSLVASQERAESMDPVSGDEDTAA